MFSGPGFGGEFYYAMDGEVVETWQHCGEVFPHWDLSFDDNSRLSIEWRRP